MRKPNAHPQGCLFELILVCMTLFCCTCEVSSGQSHGEVTDIDATLEVGVRIELRATNQVIAIPYCGENGQGGYFLCPGESHLEIKHQGGWVPARPRRGLLAVMGAEPDAARKRLLIEPGKAVAFVFTFDKALFGIQKGEPLRLQINTWNSVEAIGNHDSQVVMSSPVFECP